ncbi:hypothetical protein [Hydrogenophaga sp. 2FB]|uniref:hypothetical protein n=1 Tax=Hydrogenophaga sp. 2FB TaxID=2502187 RepID=UPI0010FA4AB7|nr:hypothetical protein [Hydrogenophaga sp. 2FB]
MPKGAITERLAERMVERAQYSGLIHLTFEMRSKLFLIFDTMCFKDETPQTGAVIAAADLALELCGTSSLVAQQMAANSLRAMHHQQIHFLLLSACHALRPHDDAIDAELKRIQAPSSPGFATAFPSDREMAEFLALQNRRHGGSRGELLESIGRVYGHTQEPLSARMNQVSGQEMQQVIDLILGFNAVAVLATRVVAMISMNEQEVTAKAADLTTEFRQCFPIGETWGEPLLDFTAMGRPGRSLLPASRT